MAWNGMRVVDGDGHVMEDWRSLLDYMPDPYKNIGRFRGRIFPPLDHLHSGTLYRVVPGAFRQVDVNGWLEFMDDVGIEGQRFIRPKASRLARSSMVSSPSMSQGHTITGCITITSKRVPIHA